MTNDDYISRAEKYEMWCEILAKAKEVLILNNHKDIRFTSPNEKYHGWQSTMKPSY